MFAWMYPRGNFFAFQIALPSFPTTDPLRIMAGMSVFQSRKVGCYKTLNFVRMDQLICFQNSILLLELTGLVRSVVSRFWNKDMIIHYKDFRRWEKSSSQKFQKTWFALVYIQFYVTSEFTTFQLPARTMLLIETSSFCRFSGSKSESWSDRNVCMNAKSELKTFFRLSMLLLSFKLVGGHRTLILLLTRKEFANFIWFVFSKTS